MTSKLILALGSVSANGTSIRLETKEALRKHRQSVAPDSLDSFILLLKTNEVATIYDPMELAGWVPLLKKDGSIHIRLQGSESDNSASYAVVDASATKAIHTSLLLAGLKATSERREQTGDWRILEAVRKATTSTKSQKIRRLKISKKVDEEADDLIDEDDLLNDSNNLLAAPSMIPRTAGATDDCSGRKPCDDCSCGRADVSGSLGPQPELTKEALVQKTSACGSCPKGDAFRCASCPFLGKPAFKTGQEHLVLNLMDDF